MMDLQDIIDAKNAQWQVERSQSEQYNIGDAILKLLQFPDNAAVILEDNSAALSHHMDSYRGYYCDLAIYTTDIPVMNRDIVKALRKAIGATYTGYKGGEFKMYAGTPLWVSDYGVASNVKLMGFELKDVDTIIAKTELDQED